MKNEKVFDGWEVNTSIFYPEGAVVLVEKEEIVKLTIFEEGQREISSCEIGNILDVVFDEAGNRRTPFEIMEKVDSVAYYENGIEVEFDDFIVDEELVDFFDSAEGLTRDEFLEKKRRESKEEDLINAPVD